MTLVKISKLEGDLCANFPRICMYVWLLWTPFVGLNGSNNSGEIDTNMFLGPYIFGCKIRPGPTWICKL